MFTGIVEALAEVVSVEVDGAAARLHIRSEVLQGVVPGDSVAVNGVCLTAVDLTGTTFNADVMAETLRRTTLGRLRAGDRVNVERAVTPTTRLGGHLVQGHVDGVATVTSVDPDPAGRVVTVSLPAELTRYVVEKGSIALDGVSLTVAALADDEITVSLIPETLNRTTWGSRAVGDRVNVEVDVLAKYVERQLAGLIGKVRS